MNTHDEDKESTVLWLNAKNKTVVYEKTDAGWKVGAVIPKKRPEERIQVWRGVWERIKDLFRLL